MSRKNKRLHCRAAESGSILITVVWMTVVFSIVAVAFASRLISQLSVVQRLEQDLESYYLLRSGAEYARSVIQKDEFPLYDSCKEGWCHDPSRFRDQKLGEGTFTIAHRFKEGLLSSPQTRFGLLDESGKLNLNTAKAKDLERLFDQTLPYRKRDPDEEDNQARELADAILDWRDEDSDRRDFGAEKFDYLNKKDSYETKDGFFDSVDELLLVKGMTPKIYRAVEPYLTVYGSGAVNVQTAPEAVLAALGISSLGASAIIGYRNGPDGIAGTEDDQAFASVSFFYAEFSFFASNEDLTRVARLMRKHRLSVSSEAFSFTIGAKPREDGYLWRAFCVLDHDGRILTWRENAGIDLETLLSPRNAGLV